MPTNDNAIVTLSQIVSSLSEKSTAATLTKGAVGAFIRQLGVTHPWFFARLLIRLTPLIEPFLIRLQRIIISPAFNALTRTTLTVTRFDAGVSDNALPLVATAIINARIAPGETVDEVMRFIAFHTGAEIIAQTADEESTQNRTFVSSTAPQRPHLTLSLTNAKSSHNPSKTSSHTSLAYRTLAGTIRHVYGSKYPGIIVAPSVLMAATDSVWFDDLSENVYKFQPVVAGKEDLGRWHGVNERIGVEDFSEYLDG